MASKLPARKTAWKQAAKDYNIQPLQLLTDGDIFCVCISFTPRDCVLGNLATSDGFPTEGVKRVKKLLHNNPHGSFSRRFVGNNGDLEKHWNLDNFNQSGNLGTPLEHLHLIAKRNVKKLGEEQDLRDTKVVWSPPKTRAVAPHRSIDRPSSSDSNLDRAKDSHDRSKFSRGDERTVNAASMDLMIALSVLLGYTGRIHHDRAKSGVPKDAEANLYSASVDGLIMHLHNESINGFMEVKGDLRSRSLPVRRRIGAQMAAFIYDQDIKKGSKGKEVEDLQRKNSQKWMVSLDGYFAYVNVATYDQKYLDSLSGTPLSSADNAFMHMKEYGPFDLRIW
ncbi:hypothetical protein BDR22DRAFT_889242 [Usnea florida]